MPTPTLTLAFLLATLIGAVFHFIIGGNFRRLLLYIWASWIGFGVGHLMGVLFHIDAFSIGTLRLLSATMGAFAALVTVVLLTRVRKTVT